MIELWYGILVLMLTAYLILDGWNIGTGVVHYALSSSQEERRLNLRALGPSWSWHEVWLISFGGTLFMAFPTVYASSFGGFYFAFFLVLWSFILRGIAIEVRNMIGDGMWRSVWDALFWLSSTLLALLIGISAGNLLRGVPLDRNGDFTLPFFTDFGVRGAVGLLDWFTIPVGIFTVLALGAHGASYVAVRSHDAFRSRATATARRWWIAVLAALPVITILTGCVRGAFFTHMLATPAAWPGLLLIVGGAVGLVGGLWRADARWLFPGGCAVLAGLCIAAGAAMFPVMLLSTTADGPSLCAWSCAIPHATLGATLVWWGAAAVLVGGYLYFVLRHASQGVDSH